MSQVRHFYLKELQIVVLRDEVMINNGVKHFVYEVDPRNFYMYTHFGRRMCNAELVAIRVAGKAVWKNGH